MGKKKRVRGKSKVKAQRIQNKVAMHGISAIVCVLLVALVSLGYSEKRKIAALDRKAQTLEQQIEAENQRTTEISDLQEDMQEDEYMEKVAKEKLGLVKDNEIIFKEAN